MVSYRLTIDDSGYWCLAAESESVFYLRVEYSKSGRAKCRACGELIKSKTVRIGKPVKWRGLITSWNHINCFWLSKDDKYMPENPKIDDDEIHGFHKLTVEEQRAVREAISRTTPPDHLTTSSDEELDDGEFNIIKKMDIPPIQQPNSLLVKLLPFQEEGLSWMVAQEESQISGGILADEMGMGKTIQTISLLLEQKRRGSKDTGPTLIVCPASAMLQWQEEIKKCTADDSLTTLVFHGDNRSYLTPLEVSLVDVVLTTFPTLEYGYRVSANAQKIPCKYCSKKFLYSKLVLHNKYFCGPYSKRSQRLAKTDRGAKQAAATRKAMKTLKIVKSSVPTPANIYRELMQSANKVPISMYTSKAKAAELQNTIIKDEIVAEGKSLETEALEIDEDLLLWRSSAKEVSRIFFARGELTKGEKNTMSLNKNETFFFSNLIFTLKGNKIDCGSFVASRIDDDEENSIQLRPAKKTLLRKQMPIVDEIILKLNKLGLFISENKNELVSWKLISKGEWMQSASNITGIPQNRKLVVLTSNRKPYMSIAVVKSMINKGKIVRYQVEDIHGTVEELTKTNLRKMATRSMILSYIEHLIEAIEYCNEMLVKPNLKKKVVKRSVKSRLKKPKTRKRAGSDSTYKDSSSIETDSSYLSDEDSSSEPEVQQDFAGGAYVTPNTSFIPASWGPKSKKFDDLLEYQKLKKGVSRKTKKRKVKRKSKQGKKVRRTASSSEVSEVYKGEFSVESSDDESIIAVDIKEKPKKPFRYAAEDAVVDEDGVDLGYSLLHCIAWNRIILDEAHKIKDRTNSTAKATFSLRGWEEATLKSSSSSKKCKRWCLTGTPLQNRVGEIYALIRFLRMDPFAYYFCSVKDSNCKQLNWAFGPENRKCRKCGHPPLRHYSYFNKHIMNPIKRSGFAGAGKRAMRVLRADLLEKTMLRRTKAERGKDLNLPELNIDVVKLRMTPAEKDFYESVYMNTRSKFDTFVKKGTLLHNYAHIFELLSRLRRAADHPYMVIHGRNKTLQQLEYKVEDSEKGEGNKESLADLVTKSSGSSDVCGICNKDIDDLKDCALAYCRHTFHMTCVKKFTTSNLKQKVVSECPVCFQPLQVDFGFKDGRVSAGEAAIPAEDESLCVICFENKREALILPCGHLYTCMPCTKTLKHRQCPVCRTPIKKIIRSQNTEVKIDSISPKIKTKNLLGKNSILQKISLDNFETSTKIDAVLNEIDKMRGLKVPAGELPHKAIVFSQYSDMIDLLEWRLRTAGIAPVKLVGSMPVKQRQAVLKAFRESEEVCVILMSLKAGGEGLNLQVASHVFILETWWNPQVHNQAYQRAHRIGQKRNVRAVLFVTEDTIEDRMHELQQKKELVFKGAVDGSSKAMQQLTEEDLRFLFSQ